MLRNSMQGLISCLAVAVSILFVFSAAPAWGQSTTVGTVSVVVLDPSGASVPGAALALKDLGTSTVRKGTTTGNGTYAFVNVPFGTFELTISKSGFRTQVLSSVIVEAGRVTDVKSTLRIGAAAQEVVVTSATPLLQTTSSAIGSTINIKQLNTLPMEGRDIAGLAFLTPGFSGNAENGGTWNGLPLIAQANTIDGIASSTNRMKFAGNATPALSARLEDIQEMTIQTSQMDTNQGYGSASMGIGFITRRGSNAYHGNVFEDFRNSAMNANSWFNNELGLPRNPLILNDFGGNVGGPILKDKLFFFGSFAMSKQPGGYITSQTFLSPLAQQGVYTMYSEGSGNSFTNGQQINLFSQVAAPNSLPAAVNNPAACGSACPNTYANVADEIAKINKSLSYGIVSHTGDPNTESISWLVHSPITHYYPAFRIDYNASHKVKLNWAFEETRQDQPGAGAPYYPGPDFVNQAATNRFKNYTSAVGVTWTITPSLINEFRGGYLYYGYFYDSGATPLYLTQPQVNWALGNSGQYFQLPTGQYYPTVSANDTATWLHGPHTFTFGFDYYREQDHYYNAPDGIPNISLGLVPTDPAATAFGNYFANASNTDRSTAENLYATLAGRISGVSPTGSGFPYLASTHAYATTPGSTFNLDELQKSWGLFFQDSYRFRPTLTFNYGLRWDFIGDNYDLQNAYLGTPLASFFGPSGIGNLFHPGVLNGTNNPVFQAKAHQYSPWNVTPQPTLGVAWNPDYSEGWLGKLLGNGSTVIRAGFDLKRFTEPSQYFWNFATNHGIGYFQYFTLTAVNGGGTGTFSPGTLSLGDSLPGYSKAPPVYQSTVPQTDFTWNYYWGEAGFDPHIQQPYVEQWNLGIQRELGHSNVLEIRYMGHHSVHQWIATNPNEVNIFENGFLKQFKIAQANLAANGGTTFADNTGNPGVQPTPIFDTAFAGMGAGNGYANPGFIVDLQQGIAGDLATQLAHAPYFCNMVGSSFTPCANGSFGNFTAPGPYPVNFFQANPYGASCLYCSGQEFMSAGGYGNYNALSIDLRQKPWHGMQFDVNYTWSHTLGVQPDNQWLGTFNEFTVRNVRLNYGPTLFDLRHVFNASGTYDLPFGSGKTYLNRSGWLNEVVGGWTFGTIFTFQSGYPFQLTGGNTTFNDYGDGGLTFLNGMSVSQLQANVGVFHPSAAQYPNLPQGPFAYLINPKLLAAASSSFVAPAGCSTSLANVCQNQAAGTITMDPWLHGPHNWNDDLSLTKVFPIRENLRFTLQGEFLNVFNHPNWTAPSQPPYYYGSSNVQSGGFGYATPSGLGSNLSTDGGRLVEVRARIDF